MNGQQICPKICDRIPDMHFVNALYIVKLILSIDIFNKSGRGRTRTYGVSLITDLQSAALAARHTRPK